MSGPTRFGPFVHPEWWTELRGHGWSVMATLGAITPMILSWRCGTCRCLHERKFNDGWGPNAGRPRISQRCRRCGEWNEER